MRYAGIMSVCPVFQKIYCRSEEDAVVLKYYGEFVVGNVLMLTSFLFPFEMYL